MREEQEKVRCQRCELVQWNDRSDCRRCGLILPQPIVKIVERVVEKVIVSSDLQSIENPEQARQLIATAAECLAQASGESALPVVLAYISHTTPFPTMAEMERTMILAAYQRSNRRTLEAARLLGIGKTTLYRKLKEFERNAA